MISKKALKRLSENSKSRQRRKSIKLRMKRMQEAASDFYEKLKYKGD